jgi:glycosyl transferase family 25
MSENISRIFYINLAHRTDRKEQIENELNRMGLTNYERFDAVKIDWFGAIGCSYSHLNILNIAKERNYENILILEDDFEFVVSKEELEDNLRNFFDLKLDYEVCMLSYNLFAGINLDNPYVNIALDAQTTAGYIIHKSMYNELISLLNWSIQHLHNTRKHWIYAIDIIWKVFQKSKKWYYFKKILGKQSDSISNTGYG